MKIKKYIFLAIFALLLYVVLGAVIPYKKQPKISNEYINSFNPDQFYSEQVSCDRALVIEDNTEALVERLRMIERADERIILSTFDFRADDSGKAVLAALLNAAKKGIDIKILVDGYSALMYMRNDSYFMALSTLNNVEIKIYNPIDILKPWKIMGRLHDKYIIIDSELYLLGGRNINNNFLTNDGHINYDRDILVYNTKPDTKESSIFKLYDYFNEIWNMKECIHYHDEAKKASKKKVIAAKVELENIYKQNMAKYPFLSEDYDYTANTYKVNKISFLTNPTHIRAKEPTLFYSLVRLMENAKNEIKIHTPYIICNDMMYEAFEDICDGNVEVTLMTNSPANNDNPFGASDYIIHKEKILKTGLNIYEYEGGISYHGKSITIDDNISIIGSFNMDLRSVYLSTEIMLVADSEDINNQLKNYMETYEANSAYVVDANRVKLPDGVKRQEFTSKKEILVRVISLLNRFRYLM